MDPAQVVDLGRSAYEPAYLAQVRHADEVLASREAGRPETGRILLVEHDPVITVGRRPGAARHLVASPEMLANAGVAVAETDRGGDVTYHGPGQLVAYPVLDLNHLGLGLHAYMRLLESAVIETCRGYAIDARRDETATGVWVVEAGTLAKVCAMGVRVRRWVSMHGLALNVSPELAHFGLIVPCGLAGRPVTSLSRLLGPVCPPMERVKSDLVRSLQANLERARATLEARRRPHRNPTAVAPVPDRSAPSAEPATAPSAPSPAASAPSSRPA